MHTLEPELRTLHREGALDDAAAARAIALDTRRTFSVHGELRLAAYAGVALTVGGVGLFVKRNFERIGPLAVLAGLLLAAAAAYAWAARALVSSDANAARPGVRTLPPIAEYTLLLGALLASAALAFAETQFRLLGPLWSWHLLILAGLHAATAYAYRSSLVLAASVTTLAGWFGVGATLDTADHALFGSAHGGLEFGLRALACAALVGVWRTADFRLRADASFTAVFDHALANLEMLGGVALCVDDAWALLGLPLVALCAWLAIRHGLRTGREGFVVYGVAYTAIALCVAVVPHLHDVMLSLWFVLLVVGIGSTALWSLYRRAKEVQA